jgi:hypothetical protein
MNSERRTVTYIGLIFISGLLLGATMMNFAEHYILHGEPANEYDIREHREVAKEMTQLLHLTSAQRRQVDTILQETVGQYQQLEERLAPQFDQLRQTDRRRLRAILDPRQRVKFDQIVARVDAKYPLNERPAVLSPVPCEKPAAKTTAQR